MDKDLLLKCTCSIIYSSCVWMKVLDRSGLFLFLITLTLWEYDFNNNKRAGEKTAFILRWNKTFKWLLTNNCCFSGTLQEALMVHSGCRLGDKCICLLRSQASANVGCVCMYGLANGKLGVELSKYYNLIYSKVCKQEQKSWRTLQHHVLTQTGSTS